MDPHVLQETVTINGSTGEILRRLLIETGMPSPDWPAGPADGDLILCQWGVTDEMLAGAADLMHRLGYSEPAPKPEPTFTIDGVGHEAGDGHCASCWMGYPERHACGGLLHGQFEDEDWGGDVYLVYRCDQCDADSPYDD